MLGPSGVRQLSLENTRKQFRKVEYTTMAAADLRTFQSGHFENHFDRLLEQFAIGHSLMLRITRVDDAACSPYEQEPDCPSRTS